MNFKITFASQDESFPLQLGEVTARIVPADPDLQDKTVTPTESTQTVTFDAPHDGLGTVTVNRIPEEYVIPSGAVTIDHNGVSDVSGYASADVHVEPVLQRKSVTPTRAAQTVEPDSGKDGLSAVDVGGIPSEYVIPEGTVNLSSNGQHDVSGKATAVVDVPGPSGTKEITENGDYDVSAFAAAHVAVSGGGGSSAWTKIAEETYTVKTTSTTARLVASMEVDSSVWTSDKYVYVRIRDTAGARNGYFYGTDNFFINEKVKNGSGTSCENGVRTIIRKTGTGTYATYPCVDATGYGVFADGVYSSSRIRIRMRYNTSLSLTIDGTYKVEVYLLDPADGVPIFA